MQETLTKQQQAHEALKEFCQTLVGEPSVQPAHSASATQEVPEEVSWVDAEEDVVYTIVPPESETD